MTDQPAVAASFVPPVAMPPGMLMWAGMYAVMFYVCGGMIAYLYNPD